MSTINIISLIVFAMSRQYSMIGLDLIFNDLGLEAN